MHASSLSSSDTARRHILVYRLGSLGDTVMALPCFHKIREQYPDAVITLLTNRPVAAKAAALEAVLGSGYFYDRVITYPVGTRNPARLLALIGQLRSARIDTVINLTAARSRRSVGRDRLFFRLAGVRTFIGFPATDADFTLHLDLTTGRAEWEAFRLARRLAPLGPIPLDDDRYWDLRLTDAEQAAADNALAPLADRPLLAISTGTKCQANDWEHDNWQALVTRLGRDLPDWGLVLLGADAEAAQADALLSAWNGPGLNLCGQTSPRVSAAVLQRVTLFAGHDSGPMHLAACVGTPCVAVFSARNPPYQWYPRGRQHQILYHVTDCAGCGLDVCTLRRKECIRSIRVDDVRRAILRSAGVSEKLSPVVPD